MSTTLNPVNLAGLTTGQTANLDLTQATANGGISWGLPGQPGPTLRLHNESGAGLQCSFNSSGQSFNLPAGGWQDCYPKPGDSSLKVTVTYNIPNPSVSQLFSTYYGSGEPVPAITTLGNSPIAGSTSGQVVTANILDNEQSAGAEFVIGKPLGDVLHAVSITNDAVVRFGDAVHPGSFTENGPASFNNGVTIALGLSTDTLTVSNGGALLEPPSTSINGGTSGSATVYMDLIGTVKRALIFLSNFRTGASAQNLALPTAFTSHAIVRCGVIGVSANNSGVSFLKSGVAQSMRVYTTPATTGDNGTSVTSIFAGSWGEIQAGAGFDTVQFQASGTAAFTGLIELVGL